MKMLRLPTLMLAALVSVSPGAPAPSVKPSHEDGKTNGASKTMPCANAEIEYEGVGFTCDPALSSEVRAEVLPAAPLKDKDDKPDYVAPERVAFTFVGTQAARRAETFFGPPHINVSRLEGFAEAHALDPSYAELLDKRAAELKAALSRRPKSFKREIPFMPYVEGSQDFQTRVRYLNFRNGRGIAFVTHYAVEPTLITNRALTYIFEGITDDGRYYVSATFPVSAPVLPDDFSEAEAVKRGLDATFRLSDAAAKKKHTRYVKQTARELETLSPDEYRPDLARLDKLLSSLRVRGRN